jgi:MFS family permease
LRDRTDWGLELGRWLKRTVFPSSTEQKYARIPTDDSPYNPFAPDLELQDSPSPTRVAPKPPGKTIVKRRAQLPFRRIFTRNVIITLLSRGVLAMHIGTFQNIWFIFLSTPRAKNLHSNLFQFTGGLGQPPSRIGIILSIVGMIGIACQLLLYPRLSARFGNVSCYRWSLWAFPPVYFLIPFLAIFPSSSPFPQPANGVIVWAGMLSILFLHVFGRTFAMPSAAILVNNCCPHPSVLSTVHGVAQSVSSGMRMLGPLFGGWGFGLGLDIGFVGFPFWTMVFVAGIGVVTSFTLREGDGHEIVLDGDPEKEESKEEMVERRDVEIFETDVERRADTRDTVRTP